MFKLAHSISIAFGFMVACVQSVCGLDKAVEINYGFSSENRPATKVGTQILKGLSNKNQKSAKQESGFSTSIKLIDFTLELSTPFSEESLSTISRHENTPAKTILPDSQIAQTSKRNSKLNPIRAP